MYTWVSTHAYKMLGWKDHPIKVHEKKSWLLLERPEKDFINWKHWKHWTSFINLKLTGNVNKTQCKHVSPQHLHSQTTFSQHQTAMNTPKCPNHFAHFKSDERAVLTSYTSWSQLKKYHHQQLHFNVCQLNLGKQIPQFCSSAIRSKTEPWGGEMA